MGYKKNIASNFITQIITSALAFVVSVIVSRVLGPEGKGIVAYFLLFFTTIGQYGHLGITYATPYFSKKTEYNEKEVFNNNFSYILFMCLIISLILLVGRSLEIIFTDYSYPMIILGVCTLTFTMIAEFLSTFYIANERIIEVNRVNLTSNLLKLFTILVLWLTSNLNLYTYLIVITLPLILNTIFLIRNLKINFKIIINKVLLSKEFKFGITIYLSTLFIFMNYKIDQVFIKFMLGKEQLGIYTVAVSLAELLFLIPGSVAGAILGRLYNMEDNNPNERKKLTSGTIKVTFYITFILMLIGIACTVLIPIVYGEDYSGAILPTIILFLGILFASIGKISASYFQSSGEPKIHLYITFIVFLINIVMNWIMIPLVGISGAAIASTISYTAYGILYVVVFIKKEKFTFKGMFLFSKEERKNINLIIRNLFRR